MYLRSKPISFRMIRRCSTLRRSFAINLKKSPEIRVTTRLSVQENIEEEQIALEKTVKAKTIRELRAIKDEYENDGENQEKVRFSLFSKK
jgi:hypothetical protein